MISTSYADANDGELLYYADFNGTSGIWTPEKDWDGWGGIEDTILNKHTIEMRIEDGKSGVWGTNLNVSKYPMLKNSYTVVFTLEASDANQEIGFYPDWNSGFILTPGQNAYRFNKSTNSGANNATVAGIEGTYGGRMHPSRKQTEADFIAKVEEVLDRGGTVLIPCFATGRTQEVMLLLRNLGYDMWVDGMGRKVTNLFLDYPEYIRDVKHLKAAKKKFNEVRNPSSRNAACKGDIIVTTGGMLDGGPVLRYLNYLKDDPKSHANEW